MICNSPLQTRTKIQTKKLSLLERIEKHTNNLKLSTNQRDELVFNKKDQDSTTTNGQSCTTKSNYPTVNRNLGICQDGIYSYKVKTTDSVGNSNKDYPSKM